MTKTTAPTPTQLAVLALAAEHPDGRVTKFPDNVKGGACTKVLMSLERAKLVKWQADKSVFEITFAGLAALGGTAAAPAQDDATASAEAPTAPTGAHQAATPAPQPDAPTAPATDRPRRTRENSKQATVVAMLQRPEGATLAQICADMGWLPHTARGLLAGALKKKLGLTIVSEKAKGGERVYRVQ